MRKYIDIIEEMIRQSLIAEASPQAPRKPIKPGEAPAAPPPPTSGAARAAQKAPPPAANPKAAATQAQQSQQGTQGTQQANAPEGDAAEDAALDATIEAGKAAEKFLKGKGVIEGYVAEAVGNMFLTELSLDDFGGGGGGGGNTVLVTDIVWDTEDDGSADELPTECTVEVDGETNIEEQIENDLSDRFGYCTLGYNYRPI